MEEKVIVQLHTEYEDLCYEGISVDTALQEMWYDTCDDPDEYEGCKFTIRGTDKEYVNNGVLFHYCFDKGRITVEELLGMLEVA